GRDALAQAVERRSRRHPVAAGHEARPGLHVEIEPGGAVRALADAPACAPMVEPAGRVGLVWRLVRREAYVAMDPEHRSPRIADDLGRQSRQPYVHLFHELPHRLAHVAFVSL